MINYIKSKISNNTKYRIKIWYRRCLGLFLNNDLTRLAKIHRTDKWGQHYYTKIYQNHFHKKKHQKLKLFEIGVGGYEEELLGGNSLRMWKSYFLRGKIVSVDIYNKNKLEEKRIKIYKGSQVDFKLLDTIDNKSGPFDIIIDDGSHINEHVIKTFEYLFPKLKDDGIYVIEDTQTSYWPDMGGKLIEKNNEATIYGFFKKLIDGLNHKEFMLEEYVPNYYDKSIISIHFYHNLIFIYKGKNEENSNVIIKGKRKF